MTTMISRNCWRKGGAREAVRGKEACGLWRVARGENRGGMRFCLSCCSRGERENLRPGHFGFKAAGGGAVNVNFCPLVG